jgi:hypothetical protein
MARRPMRAYTDMSLSSESSPILGVTRRRDGSYSSEYIELTLVHCTIIVHNLCNRILKGSVLRTLRRHFVSRASKFAAIYA